MNSAEIISKLKDDAVLKDLGVESLKLFGSFARGEAKRDSDADFLVQFHDAPTFDRYMDVKLHLENKLGMKVDLVTESALRPQLRQAIERDALRVA